MNKNTFLLNSLEYSTFRFGGADSIRLFFVNKIAPVFLANNLLRVFLPEDGGPIIIEAEAII